MKRPREKHELDIFPAEIWTYIITNFVENPGILRHVSRFFADTVTTKKIEIKHMTYNIKLFTWVMKQGYKFNEISWILITCKGSVELVDCVCSSCICNNTAAHLVIQGAIDYNHVDIIKWARNNIFTLKHPFAYKIEHACRNRSIDSIRYIFNIKIIKITTIDWIIICLLRYKIFDYFIFQSVMEYATNICYISSGLIAEYIILCDDIGLLKTYYRKSTTYCLSLCAAKYEKIFMLDWICSKIGYYIQYNEVCYKARENRRPKLAEWLNSLPDCPCQHMYH